MSEVILVGRSFFGAAAFALKAKNIEKMPIIFLKFMKNFLHKIYFAVVLIFVSQGNALSYELNDFNTNVKNYNVKLKIIDGQKLVKKFNVAVANTPQKRAYGLMNIKALPQDQAMLFLFDKISVVHMWMKNTLIPLDMIFIDVSNNIVNIRKQAVPESLEVISSKEKIDKVLEINGGLCDKFGIKIGQKIAYENF